MANNENLKPGNVHGQTPQQAQENGSKGGIASGIARQKEKVFTKTITDILNRPATDKMLKMIQNTFEVNKDVKLTLKEAMVYAQTIKAINNKDTKAFTALTDRVDGKPIQQTELTGLDGEPLFANYSVSPATQVAALKAKKERVKIDE